MMIVIRTLHHYGGRVIIGFTVLCHFIVFYYLVNKVSVKVLMFCFILVLVLLPCGVQLFFFFMNLLTFYSKAIEVISHEGFCSLVSFLLHADLTRKGVDGSRSPS